MPAKYVTHKVRDKVDKVASIMVLMERGEFEFPDGKQRWMHDESGNKKPRVVQQIAVEQVWGGKASSSVLDALFGTKGRLRELLQERIAYHRQRLDTGYRKALATLTQDGNALSVMSSKLYESLWWDLNDEETCKRIPFKERARFFEILTKMEASIKGDITTQAPMKLQPSVVIQNIQVPEGVKQRMMESIEGSLEEDEE